MLAVDGYSLYLCLAGAGMGFTFGFLFGCDLVRDGLRKQAVTHEEAS